MNRCYGSTRLYSIYKAMVRVIYIIGIAVHTQDQSGYIACNMFLHLGLRRQKACRFQYGLLYPKNTTILYFAPNHAASRVLILYLYIVLLIFPGIKKCKYKLFNNPDVNYNSSKNTHLSSRFLLKYYINIHSAKTQLFFYFFCTFFFSIFWLLLLLFYCFNNAYSFHNKR